MRLSFARYGYLTAHRRVLKQFRDRYDHAIHMLEDILEHDGSVPKCSRAFLGNQVVEDHPLLLHKVISEVERHVASAAAMMDTESIDPKTIATHQAIMHLLTMQEHEIHHMTDSGHLNHEEAIELVNAVVVKRTAFSHTNLGASINSVHQAKLDLLAKAVTLGDNDHDFVRQLAHLAIIHNYERGEALFSQGDSAHRGCYIVVQGSVKVVFETDQHRAERRRQPRPSADARGKTMGTVMTARNAAKPHHSPTSPQVTQSTLALMDKLHCFDDDEGPRGLEQKLAAGGVRQVGPVRAANSATCLFGVLSTLTCHEISTKAIATTPVLACFIPGANFAKLLKRVKKQRLSTQSDDDDTVDGGATARMAAAHEINSKTGQSAQASSSSSSSHGHGHAPGHHDGDGGHGHVEAKEEPREVKQMQVELTVMSEESGEAAAEPTSRPAAALELEEPSPAGSQEGSPSSSSSDDEHDGGTAKAERPRAESHDALFGASAVLPQRGSGGAAPAGVSASSSASSSSSSSSGASSKQPRGTFLKVDFATFLQATEFENRLLQTAAADAIELFFCALDIVFDGTWVEVQGRTPSRPLKSADVMEFEIVENQNGIILNTLGVLLQGRAAVGAERKVTSDQVVLIFGSPTNEIPVDLDPSGGGVAAGTPVRY
jgi:CRP-like cAMP-binding protein